MLEKLKLLVSKNKTIENLVRFVYSRTVSKYKSYQRNQLFLKNTSEIMFIIDKVFKELNIQYWLEYGTLLGAIREKGLIKHDYDIDLGLFLEDYSEDIQTIFEKYGLRKIKSFSIDNGKYGLEETYLYKGVNIDLFYFTKKEDKFYSHVFRNEYGKSWEETIEDKGGLIVMEMYFPYSGFKKINFLNVMCPVPKDADAHLKAFYGETYLVPDLLWNPYTMAKNVRTLDSKIGVFLNYEK